MGSTAEIGAEYAQHSQVADPVTEPDADRQLCSLAEIEANSPGADSNAIMAAYQSYTIQRQEHYKAAAAKLPTLLKGLTQVELREFEALASAE